MANSSQNSSDLDYADTLWKAADALRGQVDAAEYKHVVLGLLFLKYISDSFESRRDDVRRELQESNIPPAQIEPLLESRDEYTAERVFWVPPESRWTNLQNQATRPDIAMLIDDPDLVDCIVALSAQSCCRSRNARNASRLAKRRLGS